MTAFMMANGLEYEMAWQGKKNTKSICIDVFASAAAHFGFNFQCKICKYLQRNGYFNNELTESET